MVLNTRVLATLGARHLVLPRELDAIVEEIEVRVSRVRPQLTQVCVLCNCQLARGIRHVDAIVRRLCRFGCLGF